MRASATKLTETPIIRDAIDRRGRWAEEGTTRAQSDMRRSRMMFIVH